MKPVVPPGTMAATQRPARSAWRRYPVQTLAVLGIAAGLLCAQTNPARSAEIEKGATRLMRHSRTNFLYEQLPSELEIPELKVLVEADAALPEKIVLVLTVRTNEPPVRIAVHQRGPGTNACVLVIIHGLFANHDSWRYLTGPLSPNFDLWIIDLPGCGDSDKPDPGKLAADGYSPGAMADRIMQAVEQCLTNRTDSPRLIVIAHSLGGMTALRMAGDLELRQCHALFLRQLDGLVLFAPGDVNVNQAIPIFVAIAKLTGVTVGIGDALGIVRETAAKSTMNGFCSPRRVTREAADQLYHVLTHADERRAAQAMIEEAVPWKIKENRPDWDPIHELEKNYHNVDKPCLIVWGECDELLPVSMGYKLRDQIPGAILSGLPGAGLVVLTNCMHSIELERPDECVRLIRGFHSTVGKAPDPDALLTVAQQTDVLQSGAQFSGVSHGAPATCGEGKNQAGGDH